MMSALYSRFSGVRRLLESILAFLNKLRGATQRHDTFAPQRVCPFCGLITPRGKRSCLECGKYFKPA